MNIFDIFKKSPDYDPNLSWDNILKTWEENVLGSEQYSDSNANFNYGLESDFSFDNAVNNNQNINYLSSLFDHNLLQINKDKFTCINDEKMTLFNEKNNILKEKNSWIINRHSDCVSKPFLRFVLKKNLTQVDISNLMYLLADCSFNIDIGGMSMLSIHKLLFNFLICDKLSNPIKIFDVKSFLESNTMDEIRNKIYKCTDKSIWINQKYYVSKSDDKYIDIPLLVDFFSYNISTTLISLQYHNVEYNFNIPSTKINIISKYIDDIVLMFEEIIYSDHSFRKTLVQRGYEFIKMNSHLDYFNCWNGNQIILDGRCRTKFIFIIVRPVETNNFELELINQIDNDIDISQLPQLINVELEEIYYNGNNYNINIDTQIKSSLIELENIWVGQFENMVVYGIATDGISSMKNWIEVLNESVNSIEKISFGSNKDTNENNYCLGTNNLNLSNTNEIYRNVNLNQIKITWTDSSIPVNIEIIHIEQNLQRIMGGMTGDAYSK